MFQTVVKLTLLQTSSGERSCNEEVSPCALSRELTALTADEVAEGIVDETGLDPGRRRLLCGLDIPSSSPLNSTFIRLFDFSAILQGVQRRYQGEDKKAIINCKREYMHIRQSQGWVLGGSWWSNTYCDLCHTIHNTCTYFMPWPHIGEEYGHGKGNTNSVQNIAVFMEITHFASSKNPLTA